MRIKVNPTLRLNREMLGKLSGKGKTAMNETPAAIQQKRVNVQCWKYRLDDFIKFWITIIARIEQTFGKDGYVGIQSFSISRKIL
jgi:hypothetical protein